ncbi:ribosome biogenesis GTP-binding protein YihA/YsxC [Paenibacillus massiliensis]|uniref:ribosome biogenesis GTP-binding protein YihA/YsxC n=1 Tax=Paenibacillus massiliensis TaxID=225917 RepID=UPI000367CE00|nr:ribosome biogenesis GTP-binding protein YihA/YsxC [Paenibacillus massiliensis]
MKVTKSEFVISAVRPDQYPEDALPEVALAGRSNVGKSSLINRMINRKNLARTSSTPGKTQQLNYYRINDELYFVDFPGYGFAKVSKSLRQAFGNMIETYLMQREPLKLVLQMVDLRHPPSRDDRLMNEWLMHYDLPLCVVGTKADKIPKTRRDKHIKMIKQELGIGPGGLFIPFSSEEGLGRDELWSVISQYTGVGQETTATDESENETERD